MEQDSKQTNANSPTNSAGDDGPTLENPKKRVGDHASGHTGNLQKDPDEWVTGDEKMTLAQASYLKTLCEEAGEEYDANLTKAEASKRIDQLQEITGRGKPAHAAE
jgi:DUF3072 family protein